MRCFLHVQLTTGIGADLTIRIRKTGSVAHQPADFGKITQGISRDDRVASRQVCQLDASADEKGVAADKKAVGRLAPKSCEGGIDLRPSAGVENLDLQY